MQKQNEERKSFRQGSLYKYLHEKHMVGTLEVMLHRQCGYYNRIHREYNIMYLHNKFSERLKLLQDLIGEISLLFSWRCPILIIVLRALEKYRQKQPFYDVGFVFSRVHLYDHRTLGGIGKYPWGFVSSGGKI